MNNAKTVYRIPNLLFLVLSSKLSDESPKARAGIYTNDPIMSIMNIAQKAISGSPTAMAMIAITAGIPSVVAILAFGNDMKSASPPPSIMMGKIQSIVVPTSSYPQ